MPPERKRDVWPTHRLIVPVAVAGVLAGAALLGLASTVGIKEALTGLAHPHWQWQLIALGGTGHLSRWPSLPS
jgi:hypothetical protein